MSTFWKVVREYDGKRSFKRIGTITNESNQLSTVDTEKANLFNRYFTTIGSTGHNQCVTFNQPHRHVYQITPIQSKIDISFDTYTNSFKKAIKPDKAADNDDILPKHLKAIGLETCGLFNVIKQAIECGHFPKSWKIGKVICAYKKGSQSKLVNYRPITLLSVASKVLEKVILKSLVNHI